MLLNYKVFHGNKNQKSMNMAWNLYILKDYLWSTLKQGILVEWAFSVFFTLLIEIKSSVYPPSLLKYRVSEPQNFTKASKAKF